MDNLFYSEIDKVLFWVAGYRDNSDSIKEIVAMLNEHAEILSKETGVEKDNIKTFFVERSRRYKNMRVFYVEDVETAPEKAYTISSKNGWTMMKWIQD